MTQEEDALLELTFSWGDIELTSKNIYQIISVYDKCYEVVGVILHRVTREGLSEMGLYFN